MTPTEYRLTVDGIPTVYKDRDLYTHAAAELRQSWMNGVRAIVHAEYRIWVASQYAWSTWNTLSVS